MIKNFVIAFLGFWAVIALIILYLAASIAFALLFAAIALHFGYQPCEAVGKLCLLAGMFSAASFYVGILASITGLPK